MCRYVNIFVRLLCMGYVYRFVIDRCVYIFVIDRYVYRFGIDRYVYIFF